MLAPQSTRV